MTSIDPNRRLTAITQEQFGRLRARAQTAPRRSDSGDGTPADAARILAERVLAIDAADPDRNRKAVRIYLEAELAREFGPALLNDGGFAGMLDAIEAQLQEDAETAAAADAVGALLVARAVR